MKLHSLVYIVVCFMSFGCTMIPGSHLSKSTFLNINSDSSVEIIKIDSEIIEDLRRDTLKKSVNENIFDKTTYEYRIGRGDVLSIGVWDHPELTIPAAVQRTAQFDGFRVQSDGTITFAYAPNIPAAGKTVVELHADLVQRLSRIIEEPQVDIKVVGFNSQKVYITGEVNQSGVFPITEVPLTVLDALNQAGGLTELAAWEEVVLTRGDVSETLDLRSFYEKGQIACNRLLQDGDVIHVNRLDKHRVYVLGEVRNAGAIEINRYGLNLAEALGEAGGLKEDSANANGIFVLRRKIDENGEIGTIVYQLHAKDAKALVLASEFDLKSDDVLYVTTVSIARWNRVISKLLPLTRSIEDVSQAEARGNLF